MNFICNNFISLLIRHSKLGFKILMKPISHDKFYPKKSTSVLFRFANIEISDITFYEKNLKMFILLISSATML